MTFLRLLFLITCTSFLFGGCTTRIKVDDFHPEKTSSLLVIVHHHDDDEHDDGHDHDEKTYSFEKESPEYIFIQDWISKNASGWVVNMGSFTNDYSENNRLRFIIGTNKQSENNYVVINYMNKRLERKQFFKNISKSEVSNLLAHFEK